MAGRNRLVDQAAIIRHQGTILFTAGSFRTVLLICSGAGLLSVILGPDNNWDLRFYHLYAPWAYLHGRYLYDVGPAQYQGFFNPTADFLFYALTSSFLNETPRIIAFIMGAAHGINAALVLAIAIHVLRPLQLGTHDAQDRGLVHGRLWGRVRISAWDDHQ